MSSVWDWLQDRYRRVDEGGIEKGWLPESSQPGEMRHGSCYVEVRLVDSALRYDRDRFRGQEPVVQSLVRFRVGGEVVPIPSTIGPDSLTPLGDEDYRHLEQSNVALTGRVPFNEGDIEILAGLLTVPGSNDLTAVTGFLGKLADLVKVPQLSTVVATAQTVAEGITTLLGGDAARGLIGIYQGIGAPDLRRDGYYIAIEDQDGRRPDLALLGVRNDRLVAYMDETHTGTPGSMEGWNYMLLRVRTYETIGDSWKEIPSLNDPLQEAHRALGRAKDESALDAATTMLWAAINAADFSKDLSADDRDRVVQEMFDDWKRAVEMKKMLGELRAQPGATAAGTERLLAPDVVTGLLGDEVAAWDLTGTDLTAYLEDLDSQVSELRQ